MKGLTQHLAGRLPGSGASAAAEVKVLMDSGSRHYSNVGGSCRGLAGTAGDDAHRVFAGVRWACTCNDAVGPYG